MRLAYLSTHYPAISHTFVRREILELERRGHTVVRLAIRRFPSDQLADRLDLEEQVKTLQLLAAPVTQLLAGFLATMVTRPIAFLRALRLTWRVSWSSDRGLLRHLGYLVQAGYLARLLRRHAIEHLHVHFAANTAAVARLARCLHGPPYSFTAHGIDLSDAPRSLSLPGKVADAAFVVAVCDYTAAQLRRWVSCENWPRIHVVRCAVDDDSFDDQHPVDGNSRTFVCVGRLSPEKGHLVLIDALAQVVAAGDDTLLVFVGDGPLRSVIERRIREAHLAGRVEITGYVSGAEVRRHILAGRALVLPSFAEGLPVVIMEAFALGRPVISTYVAGIPELVRPGENGWLVPAGNVDELAWAMRAALQAPEQQLRAMGASGRERVKQRHCLETEVTRLEALFLNWHMSQSGHTSASRSRRIMGHCVEDPSEF